MGLVWFGLVVDRWTGWGGLCFILSYCDKVGGSVGIEGMQWYGGVVSSVHCDAVWWCALM